MKDDSLPTFEFEPTEEQSFPKPSRVIEQSTETIDLSALYAPSLFVERQSHPPIESTSLGRLLHALPIPGLIIDRNYSVVFCNESCDKLSESYADIVGVHFADLVSRPKDPTLARELASKANAVLDNAFRTRKAQRVEAILQIGLRKIWGCLHLRLIRIGSERHLLILIEDLTSERQQRILNQKAQRELKKARDELKTCIIERTEDLERINEALYRELELGRKEEELLSETMEFYREIFRQFHYPVIVLEAATCQIVDANPFCSTFYGYELEKLKNMNISELGNFQEEPVSFEFRENFKPCRFRHRRASGETLETTVYLTPVTIRGRDFVHFLIENG